MSSRRVFKLGLCQMLVCADKQLNFSRAQKAVQKACQLGAQVVVLPEMFNCPYSNDSFPVYAEEVPKPESLATGSVGDGPSNKGSVGDRVGDKGSVGDRFDEKSYPTTSFLSKLAQENNIWLIGGSMPERSEGQLFNTCLVLDPNGRLKAKHRKVHLFDVDIPGKVTFKESETLSAGSSVTSVGFPWCNVGIGICYDLRFPELAQIAALEQECDVLVYPGAFNTTTGPRHWELLLRARAVDNQVFVAACSPARDPDFSYPVWGHSTIVSPQGDILATTDEKEDVIVAEIDLDIARDMRDTIPVRKQKRKDMFKLYYNKL